MNLAMPVYDDMHPIMRAYIFALLQRVAPRLLPRGWWPWANDSGRHRERQADRWAQGRDEHGNVIDASKVVTMARPGSSYHEIKNADGSLAALACHVNPENARGQVSGWGGCPLDLGAYQIIGEEWEALGGVWLGRNDISPGPGIQRDLAHCELHFPGATRDQIQAAILAGQDLGATLLKEV